MGNCLAHRSDEFDLISCLDKRTDTSTIRKNSNESFGRKSLPLALERKDSKSKAITLDKLQIKAVLFDFKSALSVPKPKSEDDLRLIYNALNRNISFKNLSQDQQDLIVREMKYFEMPAKSLIMQQGKICNFFYIISSGKAEIVENTKHMGILSEGECIGDSALLNNTPIQANITALEQCFLWGMDRLTFRMAVQEIYSANYNQNKKFIDSVPIFNALNKSQKELLLTSVTIEKFIDGEKIVVEDDPGELFYLIKEGTVICKRNDRVLRTLGSGEYFGEQALLCGTPRTATVIATGEVKCLVISERQLTQALGDQLNQIIYKNSIRMAFEKSRLLSSLSEAQTNSIIDKMVITSWDHGDEVIKKGACKNEAMHVIVHGNLSDSSCNVFDILSILGEEEVVKDVKSYYGTLSAIGNVDLASISKSDFNHIIGEDIDQATCANDLLKTLGKINLFRGLSLEKLKIIVKSLQIEEFNQGKVIFEQNSPGEAFYIVKNGKVDIVKDGTFIRSITKFDYFGERSLLFNEMRSASVIASESVQCWVLTKSVFFGIIDARIRNLLIKRIHMQNTSIKLEDLIIVKDLGHGMLGDVYLVTHEEHKHLYALKSIKRNKIDSDKIQDNLILERKIMMQLDHNFIVKLIKTFNDENCVYFLLEYVRGEDLFDVIRNLNILTDEDAKFYVSCLIIILEHLHERDIVYRDLKPENVMVDEDGYLKLIDFGAAKIVNGRTYTMIGTPHYMAPEVILGKGYSVNADYWSLGIVIYEFLCGGVPFGENYTDSVSIFEDILYILLMRM